LGSAIDAALADGLADINAVIAQLEAQVDDIASGEDVDAINETLGGLEQDLADLLASNNVYSNPVNIYNVATLDFAEALGDKLNIVNGAINIYAIPEMDSVKLQTVVNRIKVVVGDFNYFAKNSQIATISFDSLSGVSDLIVSAPHDLKFTNLASAGKIVLGTNYDNKVKSVDFGSLATMTSINMGEVTFASTTVSAAVSKSNSIIYDNSNLLDLGSLPYYTPGSLSITLDSGASLDIASLDDVDSAGTQSDLNLTIVGASSVVLPNYEDGNFSATDVGTVDLAKWTGDSGTLSLSEVTHVKLGAVETNIAIGSSTVIDNDLESLIITAAKGTGTTDVAPTVKVYSNSVEIAEVGGVTGDILFSNCPSLVTAKITANSVGTITLENNANLVNTTLTGQAAGVVINNNADLENLAIETETVVSDIKDAKLDGVITVTNNSSLVQLKVTSDNIEKLTITGNSDLTSVDLSGLTKIGATGKPVVYIYNNDLTATQLKDQSDGTKDVANGASGDLGSISSVSGLATAKDYLSVVAGDADATATVYFDTVDVFTNEAGTDSSNHKYVATAATQVDEITVLKITPTTGAGTATKAKRSWIIPASAGTLQVNSGSPATNLFQNAVTINPSNAAVSLININGETNYASAAGLTLTAQQGGNSTVDVTLAWHESGTASTVIGERHTSSSASTGASSATNHGFGDDEVVTFKVGSNTVTTTVTGGVTSSTLATAATAIATAYATKYGPTGTASSSAVASVTTSGGVITVNGLDPGSRGHGLAVSLSVAAGTTTATNGLALDWTIGTSLATTDNKTDSQNIILTLEAATAGVLGDTTTPTTISITGTGIVTPLTSTQLTVGTDPHKGTYQAQMESRADVTIAEDSVAGSGGSSFSRVSWL